MNTRNTLILILLILLLVLVGLLIARKSTFTEKSGDDSTPVSVAPTDDAKPPVTTQVGMGTGRLTELVSLGKSLRCIYASIDTSLNKEKGMAYFDGVSRIRTDSQLTQNNSDKEVHVINNGAALYTWTIDEKERTATTSPLIPEPKVNEPAHVLYDVVQYNCDSWDTNPEIFIPPANIQFGSAQ